MYFKYSVSAQVCHVREVRHLAIRRSACEERDGSVTNGAEIFDAEFESAADFADTFAAYMASLVVEDVRQVEAMSLPDRNPISSVWGTMDDFAGDYTLAWFNTWAAAEKVLGEICDALARGERFFDLTSYGEDGEAV